MRPVGARIGLIGVMLLLAGSACAAGHALECPARAPAEWGGMPGLLNAVQVVSAKHGETI